MKPRHGNEQGDPRGAAVDGMTSARSGRLEAPGAEPERLETQVGSPMTDLGAWLEALEDDGPVVETVPCGARSEKALLEAQELAVALAEVRPLTREHAAASLAVPRSTKRHSAPAQRFDSRTLAERLLAESQQHAVLEAEPAELLAAQLGSDALSEELLARLLEGVVQGPFGNDTLAAHGPAEKGLLALLALQLYVHQSRRRSVAVEPPAAPEAPTEPGVVRDARLLEVLAVPHAASRPLGERRPRGRPRR
jgi:hypothetical protein